MNKSKLWLLLTIVLGVVTSLLVGNYLKAVKVEAENQVMTTVVVAAYKVPQWTRITKDMIKTIEIPEKSMPPQTATQPAQAVGQLATIPLEAEEMITLNKLASEKTSNELVYKIPEGYRAITIAINTLSGVAGHIKPGNRVDLLMTYNVAGTIPDQKVLTLTQNSLVLALGGGAQPKGGAPVIENLTLAVTPEEAQYVMLSENIGKMKLVLRPVTDSKKSSLNIIDIKSLQSVYP